MRLLAILFACSMSMAGVSAAEPPAPLADYHQHLFSVDVATLIARSAG